MYLRQIENGLSNNKGQTGEITVLPERHDKYGTTLSSPTTLMAPGNVLGAPTSDILVDGSIDTNGEFDVFSIGLVAGQTYMFSLYGSGAMPLGDTVLYLFDPGGNFITLDDDGGAGVNSLLTFTATASGTYFIGVEAYPGSGLTGQYTLDAILSPGFDVVPDTFGGAVPLNLGGITYGFVDAGPGTVYGPGFSEVDTYSFTAQAGLFYSFEVAGGADYASNWAALPPGELDTVIVIYDAAGNVVASNDDISFPSDISSRTGFFAQEGGVYYVDVFSYQPWNGGFSITSSVVNPADYDPLDAIIWANANNVPFDANNTAYVYFAAAGETFGEPGPSLGWNAYEIQQVMLALEEYEKILGVNYEITTDSSMATFRLLTTTSQQFGAYMYPQDPAYGTQQGIAAFNILSGGWAFDQQQSLVQGGYSFNTILHEFGHGHGLSHPHDQGGGSDVMLGVSGPFDSLGIYDLNQGVYTVMSYNDAWQLHPDGPSPFTAAGVDNGWTGTLRAFDIAALQQRYGMAGSYATGNTTYTLRDAQEQGTYYECIWDTGGRDEIRYDGARNARIDLLAATIDYSPTGGGVLSFLEGIWGGYTIAQGVVIENASGGSGDDALLGNASMNILTGNGGDDFLMGRGGADKLDGGADFDTASYVSSGSAVWVSLASGNGYGGDAQGDTLKNIEALQGSNFDDKLEGSNKNNTLEGMGGNDKLYGGNGDDLLMGGAGDDELYGENGKDVLEGGDGNDKLYGGNGEDILKGGAGDD
jgi:hypothetical protein